MKEIKCIICGDIIQQAYNINPNNSDVCESCNKLSKCCSEEIINGVCLNCKEHA